jgi:hypothetical protein
VLTAVAVDANSNTVEGITVKFTASSGALAVQNDETAGDGTASAILTTGGDPTLRVIHVVASVGGLQDEIDIAVLKAPSPPDIRVGVLEGGVFTPGVIAVGQSPLAAGGSSGLRVDLVDVANDNGLFNTTTSVTFTSPCVSQGLAAITSPIDSIGGSANTTYQALGCAGSDLITATTTVNGNTLIATGTIEVTQAALGSIEFVSAVPTTIGIQGTGLPETSTVVFRVRNASGGPVANQAVNFSLNTTVGGIQITPVSGTTNASGLVQTVVRAGTIHTSVRVTASATADGNTISSQSELLVITTGIPDQDSFSLSAECFNVEGLDIDGTTVPLTLRAADRFNNPVPDGTGIAFTTEGGSVVGNCTTAGGACTVNWVSQDPRPLSYGGEDNGPRAGRSTVLATAVGEESFIDTSGNGFFNTGEVYEDLPEAYLDKNENQSRQSNEEFLDFDVNLQYSPANNLFSGVLCAAGGQCDPKKSVHVRDSVIIIMSGSSPVIDDNDILTPLPFEVPVLGALPIVFVVRDVNDEPMPEGTTIAVTAAGDAGSFEGTASFTVPCQTDDSVEGNTYGFTFAAAEDATPGTTGTIELKVTVPSGLITIYAFTITVVAP